jgi:hypothetical protein
MKYWNWVAIEIACALFGVASYCFFPNTIITYIVLAIVVISAIMSIRNEFAKDAGVEMNG